MFDNQPLANDNNSNNEEQKTPVIDAEPEKKKPTSVISTDSNVHKSYRRKSKFSIKKIGVILVIVILLLGLILLVKVLWAHLPHHSVVNNEQKQTTEQEKETTNTATSTSENSYSLPQNPEDNKKNNKKQNAISFDSAIEYLSFGDFYHPIKDDFKVNINNFKLPLNIKIDVLNYYDVSRKLDLDPAIDDLNNNGFAIIDNPWSKNVDDFYSTYNDLENKQIPVLITSDFIIYYNQNVLKKVFKDIEENVFYDNLWDINKELYTTAKKRYEARLSKIGDINDSILEGERLETAYFAVALELLKPQLNQIASQNIVDETMFDSNEVNKYYFVPPPYLKDNVKKEVELIRAANKTAKSPILLYKKDYTQFVVPNEYKHQAKLYNFYLTTKWLNSVFPLNYKDSSCPDCLLDKEDWRVNLTAASLITTDFSNSVELKNKWARIYKLVSYFSGLRDDLNYVHYKESLTKLFGEQYNIEKIFSDDNQNRYTNLEKLRHKLLEYKFPAIRGGRSNDQPNNRKYLGFRMLVDYYWPSNYLFEKLVYPKVGTLLVPRKSEDNITACYIEGKLDRCNGMALDIVNLIHPVANNNYFINNTNYNDYEKESDILKKEIENLKNSHDSNYWSTLMYIKKLLEVDRNNMPVFAQNKSWQEHYLNTAASAWINFQLPLDPFSLNKVIKRQGLNEYSVWSEYSYVEPNIDLVNELIANNNMLLKMLLALKVDQEVNSATIDIRKVNNNLEMLKGIIEKELQGEKLSSQDNDDIVNFSGQLKVQTDEKNRKLVIHPLFQKDPLKEDLSKLKLMAVIHKEGDSEVISVGPVWSYHESH